MTDKLYLGILIVLLVIVLFGDIKLADSMYKTKRRLSDKKAKWQKLLLPLLLLFAIPMNGQNIQGLVSKNVNFATFELYKPMDHGTLYYFTDFKMNKDGFEEAYSEISGYLNVSKIWSLTAQYNAGLNKTFTIYPVYLGGVSKAFTLGKSFNVSIDALYRYQDFLYLPDDEKQHGYQITLTFSQDLPKISLSGYCDFWNTKYYIFEPQAFYKLFEKLWVGLEWRASNYDDILNYDAEGQFIGNYANYVMFGLKWNLE